MAADPPRPENANHQSVYPSARTDAPGIEQPLQFANFFAAITGSWLLVSLSTGICTAAALAVALLMTPIYRAEVLMSPVADTSRPDALSALSGGLGGLLDVDLGGDNKKEVSIATLKSREFAASFIEQQKLIPVLFYKKWDAENETWDVRNEDKIPTLVDAVDFFDEDVRYVDKNSKTGLVTLAIEWRDRHEAARWANLIVEQVNARVRDDTVKQAEKRIEYLNRELEQASIVALKNAIYRLIETQINTIMMANTTDEYAFDVIDPAMVPEPESKIRPKRALIVLGGLVIGFLIGTFIALIRGPARS